VSAFVVNKEHIDALVSVALTGPAGLAVEPGYWPRPFRYYAGRGETVAEMQDLRRDVRLEGATDLGRMLWGTNALSVRKRYPDLYDGGDYPGPVGFTLRWVDDYRYVRPRVQPTAVEALKLVDCFEYQSCEFHGWFEHPARYFCDALRSMLIYALPGYQEAAWEYGDKVPA
jgi:hypothetical protein